MTRVSDALDRVKVTFDDLVADVGLLLVATLSQRLGPEALVNATLCLVGRVGGERPGRKILTLVNATCVSASHSDHTDRLWASASGSVMGHRVMALSTIGTLLRAFTFGHCRQMKAVVGHTLQRACALGAGPGVKPLAIRRRIQPLTGGPKVEGAEISGLLDEVGLPVYVASALPGELSGGMCQRAALAVAMASDPAILIADEPETGLDPVLRRQVVELLISVGKAHNCGILLISHHEDTVHRLAEQVIRLVPGGGGRAAPVGAT